MPVTLGNALNIIGIPFLKKKLHENTLATDTFDSDMTAFDGCGHDGHACRIMALAE